MTDKEKLDRMKKLADAMYTAAQYLTTDASGIRKAMDEYHKFIITEYHKQEPASEELDTAIERYIEQHKSELTGYFDIRRIAKHFAQWQKEQDFNDFTRLRKSWYEEGRIDGKFEGLSDDKKYQQGFHDAREEMMKDAVEADIAESFTPVSESPNIYMHGFTCVYEEKESTPYVVAPCKIKLIIIKE